MNVMSLVLLHKASLRDAMLILHHSTNQSSLTGRSPIYKECPKALVTPNCIYSSNPMLNIEISLKTNHLQRLTETLKFTNHDKLLFFPFKTRKHKIKNTPPATFPGEIKLKRSFNLLYAAIL